MANIVYLIRNKETGKWTGSYSKKGAIEYARVFRRKSAATCSKNRGGQLTHEVVPFELVPIHKGFNKPRTSSMTSDLAEIKKTINSIDNLS